MKSPSNPTPPGRRLLSITLLAVFIAFVVFLFHALFTFPRGDVFTLYTGKWVFSFAALRLLRFLMPVLCSAYMIALSLKPGYIIPKESERSIGKILLFFIVITFFATFFNEISVPLLNRRISSMRTATETALDFKERGLEELKRENYPEALTYLKLYSSMNPPDTSIQPLLDETQSKAQRQLTAVREEEPRPRPDVRRVTDMTAEELAELAEDYLEREDYRSAYYYSGIAERLGYGDAARIKRFAAGKLADTEPEKETREIWSLYEREQEGLSLLEFERYIEAYYHFLNLSILYPTDPDIQKYLAESRERVREVAFFYEDIETYLLHPGNRDLILLNRRTGEYIEFISIGIFFRDTETAFFEKVEVLRIATSGGNKGDVLIHFSAPYGKFQNGSINLTCISRRDPEVRFLPRHLSDSPGGPLDNAVPLGVPLDRVSGFTANPYSFEETGLFELIDFIDLFPAHGLRSEPVMSELLRRAMYPFSFLIMVLLFSSAGLHWKRRGYTVSLLSYLIIPAIPVVLFFLIQGFLSIEKSLLDFIVLKVGILSASFVFLALQGILTFFAVAVFIRKVLKER
jgi:hypothetical protein